MENKEFVITLIGNDTVGKTSIVNRLRYGTYQSHYIYTRGADRVRIPNFRVGSDVVDLLIFDTGGHHIQTHIIHKFIEAADAVMIVYDVTKEKSFYKVPDWIRMARQKARRDMNENSEVYGLLDRVDDDKVLMLIGNKTDLTAADVRWSNKDVVKSKIIKPHKLQKMATGNGISLYNEVSAKADYNIRQTFRSLVGQLIKKHGLTGQLSGPTTEQKRFRFCTIL